jgi:hypothetical protein
VLETIDQDHNNFYCLGITLHSNVLNYESSKFLSYSSKLRVMYFQFEISKFISIPSLHSSLNLYSCAFKGLNQKCLFIFSFKTVYTLANISNLVAFIFKIWTPFILEFENEQN